MNRFTDRTVLITGATGGMGTSHARAFHAEDARVVIAAVDQAQATALADELGDRALVVLLDVTDADAWQAAIEATEERFGPVDILVNNAGIQHPAALIEHTDPAVWERTLSVNLTGQFLGIRAAVPSLRRAGGGCIVNIASTMAHTGASHYAAYVASKWAVRGLTKTAALELGRDNIRVNSIHPGVTATPFISQPVGAGLPSIGELYSPDPYAIPRLGAPADITQMLLFLTSSEAGFITGAELIVDGGLLLGPALAADAA